MINIMAADVGYKENQSICKYGIDGLIHERCNPSALVMALCLSCTNPLMG